MDIIGSYFVICQAHFAPEAAPFITNHLISPRDDLRLEPMGVFEGLPIVLRQLRKAADMNQTEAAEQLGVHRRTISGWENGRARPDLDALERVLDFYQLSLSDLEAMLGKKERPSKSFDQMYLNVAIEAVKRAQSGGGSSAEPGDGLLELDD